MSNEALQDISEPIASSIGDFDALFDQLDQPDDKVVINGGYSELMACITSATYRRQCGRN